jgi:tetratricopeptide (TPR) repeat protein
VPTNVLDKRTPEAQRRIRAQAAIGLFESLRTDKALQPEADLRIGFLRFTLHEPRAALESYARARRSDDPFIKYLAAFLSGRALDQLKKPDEALTQYREALAIVPRVQSATNALAASLFLAGKPDEAYALVADALAAQPRPDDPWHHFGYADLRFIPTLFDELREVIR